MTIPNFKEILKQEFKPFLKYKIGDQVFLISDIDKKYPMLITDYILPEDEDDMLETCDDYKCMWLNNKGDEQEGCFPEECLII